MMTCCLRGYSEVSISRFFVEVNPTFHPGHPGTPWQSRPDLNVNFTGKLELSPLMLACIEGNRRVVECILEREDVDINTIGKDGVLPASKGTWP